MQQKLYIVRHAQAVPGTTLLKDEMRTLTPGGEAVSRQVGEFLKQKNSNLNLILSSPAMRTRQTSLYIAQQLTPPPEVRFENLLYNGAVPALLQLLHGLPASVQEVMLVGHYPTVIELHNYLAANNALTGMSTGELLVLHIDVPWQHLTGGIATFQYSYHPQQP